MAVDLGRSSSDKLVVAVNRRVVQMKPVEKVAKETFGRAGGEEKFPVGSINITLSGDLLPGIDHNLEPNKQKVNLNGLKDIFTHRRLESHAWTPF